MELTRISDIKKGEELVYLDSDMSRKKSTAIVDSEKLKILLNYNIDYRIFVLGDSGKSRRLYFKNDIKSWVRDLSLNNMDKNPVPTEISGTPSSTSSVEVNTKDFTITKEKETRDKNIISGESFVAYDSDIGSRIRVTAITNSRVLRKTPILGLTHKVSIMYNGEIRGVYFDHSESIWKLISWVDGKAL